MMITLLSIKDFFSTLFASYSADEHSINRLFIIYSLFSLFVVLLIGGAIILFIIKYNSKKKPEEPKQIFGHKNIEIIWTVIPFLIVMYFLFETVRTMNSISSPVQEGKRPDVIVIAHQWWWELRYPNARVITANELHIPVGKRFLMEIMSEDVIHSWWVPGLGPKMDAIPGRPNLSWISANTQGIYSGSCSEYCGTQHAGMRINVIAENSADYYKWVKHQQTAPDVPKDSIAQKGAMLFNQKACLGCHSISQDFNKMHVGPDLSHFASRQTILSGMLSNTRENVHRFLEDPQKVKEGVLMPNFRMKEDELNKILTYLEELK